MRTIWSNRASGIDPECYEGGYRSRYRNDLGIRGYSADENTHRIRTRLPKRLGWTATALQDERRWSSKTGVSEPAVLRPERCPKG